MDDCERLIWRITELAETNRILRRREEMEKEYCALLQRLGIEADLQYQQLRTIQRRLRYLEELYRQLLDVAVEYRLGTKNR